MIDFYVAKKLSVVLHYIIVLVPTIYILISKHKDFINTTIRFYLIFLIWGLIVFSCNGCPITLMENKVSYLYYGHKFYPDYTFRNSDFYYLLKEKMFYVPMILAIVARFIIKKDEGWTQ